MLGGMLNKVADVAGQVTSAAAAVGMEAMAQGLDGLGADLERPFQTVAQDVVTKKKDELYNIFVAYINGFVFTDPVKICRGDAPWNAENYNKVAGDTISRTLCSLAQKDLCDKIKPVVQVAIQDHAVTSTWNGAMGKFNQVYDAIVSSGVVKAEDLTNAGVKKVDCDLVQYITTEIFKALAEIMAKEEAATRKDPAGKDITEPKKPQSFAKIFSTEPLYETDFTFWANGVQT